MVFNGTDLETVHICSAYIWQGRARACGYVYVKVAEKCSVCSVGVWPTKTRTTLVDN